MGLFDAFLNDKTNPWPGHVLESVNQFEIILKASFSVPQLIFKHSTRCNISHIVKSDFIQFEHPVSPFSSLFFFSLTKSVDADAKMKI